MIYTTLEKIKKNCPCEKGLEKLLGYLGGGFPENYPIEFDLILENNGVQDTLRCARAADPETHYFWRQLMLDSLEYMPLPTLTGAKGLAVVKDMQAGRDVERDRILMRGALLEFDGIKDRKPIDRYTNVTDGLIAEMLSTSNYLLPNVSDIFAEIRRSMGSHVRFRFDYWFRRHFEKRLLEHETTDKPTTDAKSTTRISAEEQQGADQHYFVRSVSTRASGFSAFIDIKAQVVEAKTDRIVAEWPISLGHQQGRVAAKCVCDELNRLRIRMDEREDQIDRALRILRPSQRVTRECAVRILEQARERWQAMSQFNSNEGAQKDA